MRCPWGLTDKIVNYHPKGIFIRTGPKFLLGSSSDIEIEGARYAHPLKGRYFKVETILSSFSTNYTYAGNSNTISEVHNDYLSITLDLVYGRQFIFGNSITVGWYIGMGYSLEDKVTTFKGSPITNFEDYDVRRYSHTYFGDVLIPLAITSGFNIGYIFKTPYWLSKPRVSNREPSRHSMKGDYTR